MEFLKLDYQLAYDAHRNVSFSPDKRAESFVKNFSESLKSDYEEFKKRCTSDEQRTVLLQEFERYQHGYLAKYNAWMSAKSRCISSMITGGSNFPVRRAEKANAAEHKRCEEIGIWRNKAFPAVCKKLKLARNPEQVEEENKKEVALQLGRLDNDSATVIATIKGDLPYNPQLMKDALARRLKNLAMKVNTNEVLNYIAKINETCKSQTGKVIFTDRHNIFTLINNIKVNTENPPEPKESKTIYESVGIKVVNNFNEERVQILFDDKPDVGIRSQLKGSAFRWSPRNMAWQRKNTYNGLRSAMNFAEAHFPAI